ncbi:MAG TPA: hypothetical protein VKE27_13590 [Candidatus Dormibacteraeota bacterium]|nr:hypothetical protein [Candidatus Dormibacteraeota bacterium]
MPGREFVPIVPAGFEIAGSFNGVTTAVGQGGVPRIRYQIVGMSLRTKGVAAFVVKQVMTRGIGDEVTLGSLHSKLEMALMLAGQQPETGLVERFGNHPLAGLVLGRYLDRQTNTPRYGAMGLVKSQPGLVEVFVSECDSEAQSRELVNAALGPYL